MQRKRIPTINVLTIAGLSLLMMGMVWLAIPAPAAAQCGSQASSCKNCHEVNQKLPVNTSGDWHINHAFGDFCQFCHGGNVQSNDATEAHTGMYYPLSDPGLSCLACHPADYRDRGQAYADILGVSLGTGSGPAATGSGEASTIAATAIYAAPPLGGEDVALIDYNLRYERDVLGKRGPLPWKNGVLAGLATFLTGISAMVLWRFEGLGKTIRDLRDSPFLKGDPDAPKPVPPAAIPGLDRPVEDSDLDPHHSSRKEG